MNRQEYQGNFFKSKAWSDIRAEHLERTCDLCEVCLSQGKLVLARDVYLKVSPRSLDLDAPIDPELLVAACRTHINKLYRMRRKARK